MSTFEASDLERVEDFENPGMVADYDVVEPIVDIEVVEPPISIEVFRRERHRRELMLLEHDDLVNQAKGGDVLAFELLIQHTADESYDLAYRLTGSTEDAQDIVQEAYLRAFKAIGKFRADSQFSTWMYRIVVNCANTHMDKRRKHRHSELDEIAHPAALIDTNPDHDPVIASETSTLREKLSTALDALPDKLRAVVVLKDMYDMSNIDIAKDLGISETATKVRLHRARKLLRATMFPSAATDEQSK